MVQKVFSSSSGRAEVPRLVVADRRGRIIDIPHLQAVGRAGERWAALSRADLIPVPHGSEFFLLPDRTPQGFDRDRACLCAHGTGPGGPYRPVAAFVCPGYTLRYTPAYAEEATAKYLPLFAYGAVAFYRGGLYCAAVRVDRERRQDLRGMDRALIKRNVSRFRPLFRGNRLFEHISRCALGYGCPAANNFFLQRYEAPLPTSPVCNARCLGCISSQPEGRCPVTQPRITFVPSAEEIAALAVFHLRGVRDPVVSFGQGCEGEPLCGGERLIEAIKLIRSRTRAGVINLNTNASRPAVLRRLCAAGLDSIRISLNSARPVFYHRYYRPQGYTFADVCRSLSLARRAGIIVSLNYLVMPGFTDTAAEYRALVSLLRRYPVTMIQWRNLNFDPQRYLRLMGSPEEPAGGFTVPSLIEQIHARFPRIMKGYFNPSRGRMARFRLSA